MFERVDDNYIKWFDIFNSKFDVVSSSIGECDLVKPGGLSPWGLELHTDEADMAKNAPCRIGTVRI